MRNESPDKTLEEEDQERYEPPEIQAIGNTGKKGSLVSGILIFIGILAVLALIGWLFYWIVTTIGWLWFIAGIIALIVIIYYVVKLIAGDISFSSLFSFSYKGFGRFTNNVFRIIGMIALGCIAFYLIGLTKIWTKDKADRILHPMADRGETTGQCYDENLVSIQGEGTYKLNPEKHYQYFKLSSHSRRYRTLDGSKVKLIFAQKKNSANRWVAEIGPHFDDARVISGIPSSISDDYVITVNKMAPVEVKFKK